MNHEIELYSEILEKLQSPKDWINTYKTLNHIGADFTIKIDFPATLELDTSILCDIRSCSITHKLRKIFPRYNIRILINCNNCIRNYPQRLSSREKIVLLKQSKEFMEYLINEETRV